MANKRVDIEFNFKDSNLSKMDTIIKKLETINNITTKINANKLNIVGNNNKVVINQVLDSVQKLGSNSSKLNNTWKNMFSLGKLTAMIYTIRRITDMVANLTKESSNFIENLNLTEVAFNGNTEEVKKLYNTMSDLYNLDESQIVRRIGVFKQMANAMGLSNEAGQELSSLMNKMTLDVSSLYNIDIERASNALQSALVGQTRPIRGATGADITEKTLERTVREVVPDRYIRDLSFVEKRLIMVISLTDQLKNSQGDFARTIESPSNQLRILGEQITRFARALGNVLMPIVGKVLPYLNATFMVLTEITNAIARLVGFKLPEFDYSNLTGTSDSVLDLEDALNGTNESAEKLKRSLRGFDKLNVISTQTGSGVGAGGLVGGIDQRILDEFFKVSAEYNDMMDSVRTKASQMAESMLEWLGFSKDINGEWKFANVTLGTIIGGLGTIIGGLAVGGILHTGVTKILGLLTKIGLVKFINIDKLLVALKVMTGLMLSPVGLVFAVTTLGIVTKTWKEKIDDLNNAMLLNIKLTKSNNEALDKNVEYYIELYRQGKANENQYNALINSIKGNIEANLNNMESLRQQKIVTQEAREEYQGYVQGLIETYNSYKKLYDQGVLNNEQIKEFENIARAIKPVLEDYGYVINTNKQNMSNFNTQTQIGTTYLTQFNDALQKIKSKSVTLDVKLNTTNLAQQWQEQTKILSTPVGVTFPVPQGVSQKASGGFPDVGELFIANEKGPEIISTLGGKSVVANMEQMMAYLDRRIDNKLGNNNTQKQPAIINVNVGSREYARYMLEDLNEIAKNNGQPLTIGG